MRQKAEGRRTWRSFRPELNVRMKVRQEPEQDLRQIIERSGLSAGGFEIHYQLLVSLRDDIITGCEALLRWRHPTLDMISPAEFIPVAEDTGLINVLGEWVLRTACAEAVGWPDHARLAVNVSPIQFGGQALGLTVAAALTASGLAARRLELEVTEAVLIRDIGSTVATINELRAFGVSFSLDDFGTGYSSLNYLQHFPFDKIKIDRTFVREITDVSGSPSIVQAVVNIASARNMTTVAEGVETQQQLDVLRAVGCTEI
jgi:EAL domain-containing protein (putative c-di-GMP-specific phosphodiesterase class I)